MRKTLLEHHLPNIVIFSARGWIGRMNQNCARFLHFNSLNFSLLLVLFFSFLLSCTYDLRCQERHSSEMFAAKRSELLLTQIAKRNNSHVSKQNSPYFHGLSAFCVRFKSTGTALQGTIPIMGKGVQVGQHAEVC